MSLSNFGYDILVILDDAEDPLSVDEIANRLSNERHGRISTGVAGIHLEHALDNYVERKPEGKWGIASPHHGKFSPTKQPASEAEENVERSEQEQETLDELGQLIVRLLADSDEPMLAKEIADEVSESAHGITTTDVNRRLYNSLSSLVEKDPKHQWRLVNKDYEESPENDTVEVEETSQSDYTEDNRNGDPGRSPKAEGTEDPAQHDPEVGSTETEDDSAGMDNLDSFAPSGRAGEIGARLETAKQIALFLDLAPQPLQADRLAELFEACGRTVNESTVRQCLNTTLDPFVRREDEGYFLKDQSGDAVESSTDESSTEEKRGESDSGDTPIDAVTRASVAGRRYDYVFERRELDSPALFASQIRGGTVEITLNTTHFAFDRFRHLLNGEADTTKSTAEHELQELLRFLIVAWTEVEGDLTDRRKEFAEEIRDDWGRALRFLLREQNEQ